MHHREDVHTGTVKKEQCPGVFTVRIIRKIKIDNIIGSSVVQTIINDTDDHGNGYETDTCRAILSANNV